MRDTDWTPSIVPGDEDLDVCLVMNDFGRRGRAWCETDVEAIDLETIIQDLPDGQYSKPVRVVSFNTGEGWARDISADVAEELRRRCDLQLREIPSRRANRDQFKAPGDGESKGRVRMTTVDDRMPTKDLEVEVREPACSTKVRLGP